MVVANWQSLRLGSPMVRQCRSCCDDSWSSSSSSATRRAINDKLSHVIRSLKCTFKMLFIERYPPSTPHGDGNGARATTTTTDSSHTNMDGGSRRVVSRAQVCFHFFQYPNAYIPRFATKNQSSTNSRLTRERGKVVHACLR